MTAPGGLERISKILANRGVCSRREADEYISRGWVLVDGKVVRELGTKARPDQDIRLAKPAQRAQAHAVTVLLNKPVGFVSLKGEDGYRDARELLTVPNQIRADGDRNLDARRMAGLAPAGRLDIDSRGLMVYTQDGRIARALIGEKGAMEKEYLVRVKGKLDQPGLARLNAPMLLDGEPTRAAKVNWINQDQLRFVLTEGKKRQIRRMCELVGLRVEGLKRVRIGRVVLGSLPEGKWRTLKPWEKF